MKKHIFGGFKGVSNHFKTSFDRLKLLATIQESCNMCLAAAARNCSLQRQFFGQNSAQRQIHSRCSEQHQIHERDFSISPSTSHDCTLVFDPTAIFTNSDKEKRGKKQSIRIKPLLTGDKL